MALFVFIIGMGVECRRKESDFYYVLHSRYLTIFTLLSVEFSSSFPFCINKTRNSDKFDQLIFWC